MASRPDDGAHAEFEIDSGMLAALKHADFPLYLVPDLILSGKFAAVYRAFDSERTTLNRALTTAEMAALVNRVIEQITLDDLQAENASVEQGCGVTPEDAFFPLLGSEDDIPFPGPVDQDDPHPASPILAPVLAVTPRRLHADSTLLRIELLLTRWRREGVDAIEVLDAIQALLSRTMPTPEGDRAVARIAVPKMEDSPSS